jgi:hypothetical protein
MPTLTADEITDVRLVTGSNDTTTVISDAVIQAQYDLAYVDAPSSAYVMPYTYVYILRRLWGYQRVRVNRTTDHGDRQERQQIVDNTKAMLDYWEAMAGLGGMSISGRVSVGTLNLDLDWTEDDTEAEESA